MYKVLTVDDEKMIRMGIRNGIPWEKLGIDEVFTAASAKEAIAVIEEHHPQIMMTDISMTEMTGLDLIDRIRNGKDDEDMRILVLTGYDRFDYARQCLKMRVQNFLLKPIDEEVLMENLREQVEALEEIRITRENEQRRRRTEGVRQQMMLEQFLQNLVHGKEKCDGNIQLPEELEKDKYHSMQIAILLPDLYVDTKEKDDSFRLLTVKNICMGLVDARKSGITFVDDDENIVIAFFTDIEKRNVTEIVQELCEILEDEYDMKPRVVLGSEVSGLDSLMISYNDAIHLLKEDRVGFREIVRPNAEQRKEQMIQDTYREFKQAMVSNLANGDYVMHVFDNYQKAVFSYNLSRTQVQKYSFELASAMYFTYFSECKERMESCLDDMLKSLLGADREETLEITRMFIRQIVFRKEDDRHEIITKTRHYIEEHLDTDLSVASLAEMFYVSPNYFSRLFKKVMGEGCNEYIVRKRIEKSKSLLAATTIKTGKIALMVGYNDTNYFSLAFKKHVGMSPTRYREQMQEKDRKL